MKGRVYCLRLCEYMKANISEKKKGFAFPLLTMINNNDLPLNKKHILHGQQIESIVIWTPNEITSNDTFSQR